MPLCEKNAIDSAPLSASFPGPDDMVWFILPDETVVFRKWSTISAGIVPPDEEYSVVASGTNTNQVVNANAQVFLTHFIGRRLRVYRGSVPQSVLAGQYTWNQATGELNVTPAPSTGEIFLFQAY
jgi:hypothetical protein